MRRGEERGWERKEPGRTERERDGNIGFVYTHT
jgi:hypothetical protein